jgi:hypothetical protein
MIGQLQARVAELHCPAMRFEAPHNLEDETWTREELKQMNTRFATALERAFELGLESRESARREVKLPESPGPRWSTPPCAMAMDSLLQSAMGSATMFVARG